jgi:hypothetical protein
MWNMEVEQYILQKGQLEEKKVILHTIIWEQCTKSLCIKLKGTDGYETAKEDSDCLWLLRTIRGISLNYESTKPKLSEQEQAQSQEQCQFRNYYLVDNEYCRSFSHNTPSPRNVIWLQTLYVTNEKLRRLGVFSNHMDGTAP